MTSGADLVLSLFPGIGLLDQAFEEAGFCMVRGPDLLWGGDVRSFHPPRGRFDGIVGGPPCQAFSRMRHIVEANGFETSPNLIPEFERVVSEAAPAWFLMENVTEAPLPVVPGYLVRDVVLSDHWVGGETSRQRRFSFGTEAGLRLQVETLALHRPDPERAAMARGGGRTTPVALGGSRRPKRSLNGEAPRRLALADHARLQGLPEDFDLPPFTASAKIQAIGNGVPLAMGRAVAAAVRRALDLSPAAAAAA